MIMILYFIAFLQDIGTVYQIFADEVLGSGQFGVVYGGREVFTQWMWYFVSLNFYHCQAE